MRCLVQPGPVHLQRIDSFGTNLHRLVFPLPAGRTLTEAVTTPLVAAGFRSATLRFTDGGLAPFRYVMPAPAEDAGHVAYFSAPRTPAGEVRIEQANASFGWADGAPFLHCHAVWIEADGARRGGHILPRDSIVATPATVEAWGTKAVSLDAAADAETNFTLLLPSGPSLPAARGVVARVKPNEDITGAIETVARRHGLRDALVRGSIGSLVGAQFADGRRIADDATEVLVRDGSVRDGVARLDLLVVDMQGQVHAGTLARGENAVCITFDVMLEAS